MRIRIQRKAAAFRRGGFLLFVLLWTGWALPSSAADEVPQIELTAEQRELVLRHFVLSNLEFTILHEIGHAIIHQFPIPVFGLEEDAADQIATTSMILKYGVDVDPAATHSLLAVSAEWLTEWREEVSEHDDAHAFWDSHSLSIQRFYNINCLLFGANPDELSFLLDSELLPAERGFDCDQAYELAYRSYLWLLEYAGREAEDSIPYVGLVVAYDETRDPRHEKVRQWAVESGMVQDVVSRATEFLPWPNETKLLFANCPGSPEAYYNRNVHEIVICYELVALFLERGERTMMSDLQNLCLNAGLRRLFGEQLGCRLESDP